MIELYWTFHESRYKQFMHILNLIVFGFHRNKKPTKFWNTGFIRKTSIKWNFSQLILKYGPYYMASIRSVRFSWTWNVFLKLGLKSHERLFLNECNNLSKIIWYELNRLLKLQVNIDNPSRLWWYRNSEVKFWWTWISKF